MCTSFVRLTPSLKTAFDCSFASLNLLSESTSTLHGTFRRPWTEFRNKGFFIRITSRPVSVHRLTLFCFSERHCRGLIYWFKHAQKNHSCSVCRSGIGFQYAYKHLNTYTHTYTTARESLQCTYTFNLEINLTFGLFFTL